MPVTHNHPNKSPMSIGDVYWMCEAGFGEFRTSNVYFLESLIPGRRLELKDYYFVIRPAIKKVGAEMGLFDEDYSVDFAEGAYATEEFVQNFDPELECNAFTVEDNMPWHDFWNAVAKECGMEYKVMEW